MNGQKRQLIHPVSGVVAGGIGLAEGVDLAHDDHGAQRHQGHLNPGGKAHAHDLPEEVPVKPQRKGTDGDLGITAVDEDDAKHPGNRLGEDGGQGHAQHAHSGPQHQGKVQDDVQNGRDGQKQQRGAAVAKAAQNAGVEIVADGADESRAHHGEIEPGVLPDGGIHPQHHKQRFDQSHCRQGHRQDREQEGGVNGIHGVPDPLELSRAVELGNHHGAAVGKAGEERGKHKQDRKAHAHGGQSGVSHIAANHEAVHHVV